MNNYSLKKNPNYGFLQVDPTPSKDEIAKYYADEFYATSNPAQVNDSSIEVQIKDQEFYQYLRKDIRSIIESNIHKKNISIYDFGCGWCETLSYFKELGYDCYGIDTATDAVLHGRSLGLNVEVSDLEDINPFNMKFDVVIMQNVLEHLASPEMTIKTIFTDILNEDGLLIIDVPNEFNQFQVSGKEVNGLNEWWVAPPAHLNYFNPESLRNLLEGEGFLILDEIASFPLEMFLLMGENYVGDPKLGRTCHEKRMAFEHNLRSTGRTEILHDFYRSLAKLNLGRQILTVAKKGEA